MPQEQIDRAEQVRQHVKDYLARGGIITRLHWGQSGLPEEKPARYLPIISNEPILEQCRIMARRAGRLAYKTAGFTDQKERRSRYNAAYKRAHAATYKLLTLERAPDNG
jgi:hypothetical protein